MVPGRFQAAASHKMIRLDQKLLGTATTLAEIKNLDSHRFM